MTVHRWWVHFPVGLLKFWAQVARTCTNRRVAHFSQLKYSVQHLNSLAASDHTQNYIAQLEPDTALLT